MQELHFGRAVVNADFTNNTGQKVRIRAGQSILTKKPLHHNKPAILLQFLTPYRRPFYLKFPFPSSKLSSKGRNEEEEIVYNSMSDIYHRNLSSGNRDTNLGYEISQIHQAKVKLGFIIIIYSYYWLLWEGFENRRSRKFL